MEPSDLKTNPSNILVTGGSGFIGSHVSSALQRDSTVRILDMNPPSTKAKSDFAKGNVMDLDSVVRASKGCEVVIHLAAMLGVARTEANLLETLDVNMQGTRNVLEACRVNEIRKIIFSSSSEIYGEPISFPIRESDPPRPVTTYGISKLAAEYYIQAFSAAYGTKYTIMRFFNVYGPHQSTQFVLPRFVQAALRGEPLVVHGDGSQVRSFSHVSDISDAIGIATHSGDNEIFNIGNDSEPISIHDLASRIIALTSSRSPLIFQDFSQSGRNRRSEITWRIPSIEKAKELLRYQPKVSLDEGLATVIESMRGESS